MTREDWRDLTYWCAVAGAYFSAVAVGQGLLVIAYFLMTGNLWPVV